MSKDEVRLFENAERRKELWGRAVELENQFSLILRRLRIVMQNDVSYKLEDMTREEIHEFYSHINDDLVLINQQVSRFENLAKDTTHYITEIKSGLKTFSEPLRDEYLKIAGELIAKEINKWLTPLTTYVILEVVKGNELLI